MMWQQGPPCIRRCSDEHLPLRHQLCCSSCGSPTGPVLLAPRLRAARPRHALRSQIDANATLQASTAAPDEPGVELGAHGRGRLALDDEEEGGSSRRELHHPWQHGSPRPSWCAPLWHGRRGVLPWACGDGQPGSTGNS
jgi:hypothetical protein